MTFASPPTLADSHALRSIPSLIQNVFVQRHKYRSKEDPLLVHLSEIP